MGGGRRGGRNKFKKQSKREEVYGHSPLKTQVGSDQTTKTAPGKRGS